MTMFKLVLESDDWCAAHKPLIWFKDTAGAQPRWVTAALNKQLLFPLEGKRHTQRVTCWKATFFQFTPATIPHFLSLPSTCTPVKINYAFFFFYSEWLLIVLTHMLDFNIKNVCFLSPSLNIRGFLPASELQKINSNKNQLYCSYWWESSKQPDYL